MVNSPDTFDEVLCQIVFDGSLTGEFELEEAKSRFKKLFKVDDRTIERPFSGKDYVIKANVSEDRAMKLAIRIVETGCECQMEIVPEPDDISQEPGFVERRKGIRRLRYRRDPRAGVIVPDRRLLTSRRKVDFILLHRDGDFPGNSVSKK